MKTFLLTCIIASTLFIACKDEVKERGEYDTEKNIYRSADSMMAAFKRHDYKTFAKYNHPAMTKIMGGPEAFALFIAQQMKQIPDTAIKRVDIGKILQIVKTGKDMQCVIEQHMVMEMEGNRIKQTSYIVGESLDTGKNWTFFDASVSSLSPTKIKPDLSPQLIIPPQKKVIEKL